jgi:hypothetical protein
MFTRIKRKLGFKRRLQSPHRALGTPVSMVINEIQQKQNLGQNYLEVGVEYGFCFEAVRARHKTAVDPCFRFQKWPRYKDIALHEVSSDVFFQGLSLSEKFDLVFLDGLHTAQQTWKDFENVANHLSTNSVVIIDDTVPNDEYSSELSPEMTYRKRALAGVKNDYRWHGDVYKVILKIVEEFPSINIVTVVDVPNPFTVCWNVPQKLYSPSAEMSDKTYSQVFGGGIPSYFNPKGRLELLRELGKQNE